jgi:hypothetical protein
VVVQALDSTTHVLALTANSLSGDDKLLQFLGDSAWLQRQVQYVKCLLLHGPAGFPVGRLHG